MTRWERLLRGLAFWRPFKFRVWLSWRLLGVLTHEEHLRWRRSFDKAMGFEPRSRPGRRRAQRRNAP